MSNQGEYTAEQDKDHTSENDWIDPGKDFQILEKAEDGVLADDLLGIMAQIKQKYGADSKVEILNGYYYEDQKFIRVKPSKKKVTKVVYE